MNRREADPEERRETARALAEAAAFQSVRLLACAVGLLPRTWGLEIGAFLGRLVFALDRRHRRVAEENLRSAYGREMTPAAVRATARRVFENLGKVLFEVFWSWHLPEKKLLRYFRVEGLIHMQRACRKNRGVFALTGHFGNWELLSVVVAFLDRPISIVYRPLDFSPLSRFVEAFRRRFGADLIHRRRAMRRILSNFKEGEIVAILLDQSVDWYEGVFVDFFGRRTCTNQAMARLALKTGAPVIPVFLIRENHGFTAAFLPEIPLVRTGDLIKDVETNTENYNQAIESVIRKHPDQWFWVHRRWKTRPYQPWQPPAAPRQGRPGPSSAALSGAVAR